MGLGMPIPDLSNKPGPGRPGYGPTGSYAFQFEVSAGQVGITVLPNTNGQGFTVKWQNGATQIISAAQTNLQSPTTQAGIISINKKTDQGFCDDFAVVSGQQFVTKVISWGENPWNRLVSAFENCVNLTSVEKTKLYGVNTIMESTFEQCSSLVSADLSELNVSNNISIYRMFKDCTALQFLSIKNSNSKLNLGTLGTAQSQIEAFMNVGSGVSTGCEVIIKDTEFVNVRNTATVLTDMFRNVRFKDTSDLSGLSFSGLAFNYSLLFQYAHVTQDNSFLNISNWSFNHTNEWSSTSLFFRFNNDAASGVNTDIDTTGWNFGKVTGLSQWFYYCNIRTIRGLSTWTRDNSVLFVTLFRAFNRWFNAKIPSSDNFSSSFWANSRLSGNQAEMFQLAGSTSIDTETGSFPNLNGLALNAYSCGDAFRGSKWNTRVDFTGVSQYTGSGQVAATDCQRMFQSINVIGSDQKIVLNIDGLKILNARTLFYVSNVESIDVSSVVDFSSCVNFQFMFLGGTPYYDGNVTLPTNIDFSSATSWNGSLATNHFPEISFSTCQIDNLIRRVHATLLTPPSASVNMIYSPNSQVTEAPSVVQAQEAELVVKGWSITANTTDATLPFAYASYAVDPTGITTISPTTTPPAGSVFTATNGLTISSSGVITINTFRGDSTIRCTYPDGCYNEVVMLIQVPFVMRIVIPSSGSTTPFTFKPQMSAGECFIDWGDTTQTLTANTTHNYPAAGSDTTYDIKVFDSPSGSKFTGMSGAFVIDESAAIDKSIMKWGEIEWQNNTWFSSPSRTVNKLRISAPNGAAHKPDLSQVTSLNSMFYVGGISGPNLVFEDVNNNLANWDVSTIVSMASMFSTAGAPLTRPSDGQPNTLQLSNWDVSNVTDFSSFMLGAFQTANGTQVNNLGSDITNWDTSSATNMASMFNNRGVLTGVENLNTSNVTNMSNMFAGRPVTGVDFRTKLVNGTVRWSVKKVTNFSGTFRGYSQSGEGDMDNTNFPSNWWISGEGQDVRMDNMFGADRFNRGRFQNITDNDAFATKTIASGSSPYGSSYTAWDMSNTTTLANFAFSGRSQFNGKNYNISSWQISNKCTSLANMFLTYYSQNALYDSLDQDLGHWDISNVTSIGGWMLNSYPGRLGSIDFSTVNYNSLLDITTGWGQYASSVQSPVTLNMGTSTYTAGGNAEAGKTALINAGWTIIDGGAVFSNTNALSFDGSQHINVGEDINSTFQGAFSFSCYIWFNNIDGSFQSFLTSGFPVQAYIVNGAVQMYLSSTNSNSTETLPTSSTLTAGEWHHVAFTRSGNGAGSENKIYLNGGVADVTDTSSTIIPLSTSPINIGASTNPAGSTSLYFTGKIDEVMIWNTVLTQGEVQSYANAVGSGSIPDPNAITGLQMWNRMGD